MINILFHVPIYYYEVKDWDRKKKALISKLDPKVFKYYMLNDFASDRHVEKNSYSIDIQNIFDEELNQFKQECRLNYLQVTDAWTLKYNKKGEYHCPHNHGSNGFSAVLYLEFDPEVHEAVTFVGPWNDPVNDRTLLSTIPNPKEGTIYIWPSVLVHYVDAMKTNKPRMVTSWDMQVK